MEERRFFIDGIELAALYWPGTGLPRIALHGWLDNAASFIPLAPHLEGGPLLALDLVGHGRSDHLPAAADYHLVDNIRWVVAVADAMGWERFALIGHSMGAAIATLCAAALPQRITTLVLIDGLGPLAYMPQQAVARLRQRFGEHLPVKVARPYSNLDTAVQVRQRLSRFPIDQDSARLIAERGMAEGADGFHWSHDPRLKGPSSHYFVEAQAEAVLGHIEAPTLLISASEGAFRGWDGFARRKGCVRRLQHVELTGGHHLHMSAPEAVARLINTFFAVPEEVDA